MDDRFPPVDKAFGEYRLSRSLNKNEKLFRQIFKNDDSIVFRRFTADRDFLLIFVNAMVQDPLVNDNIIRPIEHAGRENRLPGNLEKLTETVVAVNESQTSSDFGEIFDALLYGDTILLMDRCKDAAILSTKGWQKRSVDESENEKSVYGPKEAFSESLMVNLSLVRRKLRNPAMKVSIRKMGRVTRTSVAVCWVDGVVEEGLLELVNQRLNKLDMDVVLDSNYIAEQIGDHRWNPFSTTGSTERPDVVTSRLCEGRVAIIVDGSPSVVTVPHLMVEYFQSQNDYYSNFSMASFSRILRYVGFLITVSLPAVYVSVVTFHPEMLPPPLLVSVLKARQGVPMPTALEVLLIMLMLEILQEAGLLAPSAIGQPLSIVGGLVLGQAAVDARIVSAPVLIVVAVWAVTNMMLPSLRGVVVLYTFLLLGLSSILGLYGYVYGIIAVAVQLSGMRSFGASYTDYFIPWSERQMKDSIVRSPWWMLTTHPLFRRSGKQRKGGGL